jgi:hypothetical protein
VSTRRVEKLVEQLGVASLSKSQVSEMAAHLDVQVEAFRNRPLDAGPYTFVWVDALTIKVREAGRTVNVHALIAVGVNGDGQREVLGLDVSSQEDGAGWLAFLRSLTARGLSGVRLVISVWHFVYVGSWYVIESGPTRIVMRPANANPLMRVVAVLRALGAVPCVMRRAAWHSKRSEPHDNGPVGMG